MKYDVLKGHEQVGTVEVKGLEHVVLGPVDIRIGVEIDCPCGEHRVQVDFVGAGRGTREHRPAWDDGDRLTVEGRIESPCGRSLTVVDDAVAEAPK